MLTIQGSEHANQSFLLCSVLSEQVSMYNMHSYLRIRDLESCHFL
jgi:hypothetical protein